MNKNKLKSMILFFGLIINSINSSDNVWNNIQKYIKGTINFTGSAADTIALLSMTNGLAITYNYLLSSIFSETKNKQIESNKKIEQNTIIRKNPAINFTSYILSSLSLWLYFHTKKESIIDSPLQALLSGPKNLIGGFILNSNHKKR